MPEARAIAKYIRISPRKARHVIDLIRGKMVSEAVAILRFSPQRASTAIEKVVKSAAANAENNFEMNKDGLYIAECFIDQGPTLKRFNPRAMGRADLMKRRTSHITVVVREKEEGEVITEEPAKKAAPKKNQAKKEAAGGKKEAASRKKEAVTEDQAAGEKKKTVRQKKEG